MSAETGGARHDGYTVADKERALAVCAVVNGSARRAHRVLKEAGYDYYSLRTIQRWKTDEADRYHEIRTQVVDKVRAEQAEEHSELGRLAMDLERRVLSKLKGQMKELEPRDLSTAHRNLAVAAGIHAQRAGDLRGDATVVEHKSGTHDPELARKKLVEFMEREGFKRTAEDVVLDAEAVEVKPEALERG